MKRKNYLWDFASFLTIRILLPIYILLTLLFVIVLYFFEKEYLTSSVLLIILVFWIALLPAFFIFALIGNILYKRFDFRQDENYYYSNKKQLAKNNLKIIKVGKLGKIYFVEFEPVKNGFFVSSRLLYYFANYMELDYFIFKNELLDYLNPKIKDWMIENHKKKD